MLLWVAQLVKWGLAVLSAMGWEVKGAGLLAARCCTGFKGTVQLAAY